MKKRFWCLGILILLLGQWSIAQAKISAALTEQIVYEGIEISVSSQYTAEYDENDNIYDIMFSDKYMFWSTDDLPANMSLEELANDTRKAVDLPQNALHFSQWDSGIRYALIEKGGNEGFLCYIFLSGNKVHYIMCGGNEVISKDLHAAFDDIMATTRVSPDVLKAQEAEAQFKHVCQSYTYEAIARNPEKVRGKCVVVSGQVIQVMEDGLQVALRVNITKNDGWYTDTIYVTYTRKDVSEDRILENDVVTLWGTLEGLQTYTSILGSQVTLPLLQAKYIEIDP